MLRNQAELTDSQYVEQVLCNIEEQVVEAQRVENEIALTALSYIKQIAGKKNISPVLEQEIKIFINDIFNISRFNGNQLVATVSEENLRVIFSTSHQKGKIYQEARKILKFKKSHPEITMLALRDFIDQFIKLHRATEKNIEKVHAGGEVQLAATPHADDLLEMRDLLFTITPDGADALQAFHVWQLTTNKNNDFSAISNVTESYKSLEKKAIILINKLDDLFNDTNQTDGWVWQEAKEFLSLWLVIKQRAQTECTNNTFKINFVASNFAWLEDVKEECEKSEAANNFFSGPTYDCLANTFTTITAGMYSILLSMEVIEKVYKYFVAKREHYKEDDAWNKQFAEWRVDTSNLRNEAISFVEQTLADISAKLAFLKSQAGDPVQQVAEWMELLHGHQVNLDIAKHRQNFRMKGIVDFIGLLATTANTHHLSFKKIVDHKKAIDLEVMREDYLSDVSLLKKNVEALDRLVDAKFSVTKEWQETERKLRREQGLYQENERKNRALQAEVEKRKASIVERSALVASLRAEKKANVKVVRRMHLPRIISEEPASCMLRPETYKSLWELAPKDRQLIMDIFNKEKNIKFRRACTVYKRLGGNVNRKGGGSHHYFAFSFQGVSDTTMVVASTDDVEADAPPSHVATNSTITVKSRMHKQHDGDTTILSPMNVKFFTEGLHKVGITQQVMLELEDKLLRGIPFAPIEASASSCGLKI